MTDGRLDVENDWKRMGWEALFDRAEAYDVSVEEIESALSARRDD
ncbi:hypothetical protein [Halocatena pleomorpha]|nr:hypothetical protein [Halocatena pleomorpha]